MSDPGAADAWAGHFDAALGGAAAAEPDAAMPLRHPIDQAEVLRRLDAAAVRGGMSGGTAPPVGAPPYAGVPVFYPQPAAGAPPVQVGPFGIAPAQTAETSAFARQEARARVVRFASGETNLASH